MQKSNAEAEKEAEDLERQAKAELAKKNYDLALLLYMDAKDLYVQIGFKGQVGIIDKHMTRIKKLMELEKKSAPVSKIGNKRQQEEKANNLLEKARNLCVESLYDNAIKTYTEAYEIFEELGFDYQCKKISNEINKLKDLSLAMADNKECTNVKELSIAEERRLRVQKQIEEEEQKRQELSNQYMSQRQKILAEQKKREEELQNMTEGMRIRQQMELKRSKKATKTTFDQRKKELEEREKKLKALKEQKKEEELKINKADRALSYAKTLVDKKEFKEAKQHYNEAIEIFSNLGWDQQVIVLKKELRNIDKYEKEHAEKMKQEFIKKKKKEKEFQQRVDTILAKKKKKEEERLAKLRALPPELQKKLEMAKMALQKAEKEEKLNRLQRVIGRYKYALEIYKKFPQDKMDLSSDISEIEQKISEIESKM